MRSAKPRRVGVSNWNREALFAGDSFTDFLWRAIEGWSPFDGPGKRYAWRAQPSSARQNRRMNRNLSEAQFDAYLEFLGAAILEAPAACGSKQYQLAGDLMDMLHNLPTFLRGSPEAWFTSWSAGRYFELFVAPMVAKYPHLHLGWHRLPR